MRRCFYPQFQKSHCQEQSGIFRALVNNTAVVPRYLSSAVLQLASIFCPSDSLVVNRGSTYLCLIQTRRDGNFILDRNVANIFLSSISSCTQVVSSQSQSYQEYLQLVAFTHTHILALDQGIINQILFTSSQLTNTIKYKTGFKKRDIFQTLMGCLHV